MTQRFKPNHYEEKMIETIIEQSWIVVTSESNRVSLKYKKHFLSSEEGRYLFFQKERSANWFEFEEPTSTGIIELSDFQIRLIGTKDSKATSR